MESSGLQVWGIPNIGNTWYLNSWLQCLLATKQFSRYFDYYTKSEEGCNKGINGEAAQLFIKFYNERQNQSINTQSLLSFKQCIQTVNSQFEGNKQQDASEWLSAIFEALTNDF